MSEDSTPGPRVLWEGEGALAVEKRSGELVHNSHFAGPKEFSLKQRLGQAVGRRVYPVHRLDRGTSGIVVFSRESADVGVWQAAVGAGEKEYLAIVRGRMREPHLVVRPVRDESGVERSARSAIVPLAVSAVERVTLVGLRLFTGRHHQARRHCVHLRHPIVGDSTHGDTKFNRAFRASTDFDRLGLHAYRLAIVSPDGDRPIEMISTPGGSFARAIESLFDVKVGESVREMAALIEDLLATSEEVAEAPDTKNSLAGP